MEIKSVQPDAVPELSVVTVELTRREVAALIKACQYGMIESARRAANGVDNGSEFGIGRLRGNVESFGLLGSELGQAQNLLTDAERNMTRSNAVIDVGALYKRAAS